MEQRKPTVHGSEIVHKNPWYQIRHDVLTWPNGVPGNFYVLEPPVGGCLILAVQDGQLLVVEQHRHTIQKSSVEFPKGGISPNEQPKDTAQRELREETGYSSASLTHIGTVHELVGAANYPIHIFLAIDLIKGDRSLEETECDLDARWIPEEEMRIMIKENIIQDSATLAAWALYQEIKLHPKT